MEIPCISQDLSGSVLYSPYVRIVEVGRCCWNCVVQDPAQSRVSWNRSLSAVSHVGFEYSKDRDSISCLGNLGQCLTVLTEICILPWDLNQGL